MQQVSIPTRESAPAARDGTGYRFRRLSLPVVMDDMSFSSRDPAPGAPAPSFDLPTLDGGRFRSGDLDGSRPVLLVFGSMTCPMTDNAAPGLNALHRRFGPHVRFVMVAVREAHPGSVIRQPQTFEEKRRHAGRLRDLHGIPFEIAVDDADGTLHRALSPKPNSAYLLGKGGVILFRAHWANDSAALAEALAAVAAGEPLRRTQSLKMAGPMLRMLPNLAPALDRAGKGAWADMWRVMPPLAAAALVCKTLRIRPRARG